MSEPTPNTTTPQQSPQQTTQPTGGAVTSKNLSSAPVQDKPAGRTELDDMIVARPLGGLDISNLKHKNPGVDLRWIKFGESDASRHRFQQAMAQGYVPCRPDEITTPLPHLSKDDKIINSDTILCKMDRRMYRGALLANEEQAVRLANRAETLARGKQSVREEAKRVNAPESLVRKISVFSPSQQELEGVLGPDREHKK